MPRDARYVTARTVSNRLDEVLGPENWSQRFFEACKCLVCEITITLPNGDKVSKQDGGGFDAVTNRKTGEVDQGTSEKGWFSDSFKRAAAMFGVGRYLYGDGLPAFIEEINGPAPRKQQGGGGGNRQGGGRQQETRRDDRPRDREDRGRSDDRRDSQRGGDSRREDRPRDREDVPKSGKALFRAIKIMEEKHHIDILDRVNEWAEAEGLPKYMTDWADADVPAGYKKAMSIVGGGNSRDSRGRDNRDEAGDGDGGSYDSPRSERGTGDRGEYIHHQFPTTGKELKTWISLEEKRVRGIVLPVVQKWGQSQGFDKDMWTWEGDQVKEALEFAIEEIAKREESDDKMPAPKKLVIFEVDHDDDNKALKLQMKLEAQKAFRAKLGRMPNTEIELRGFINDHLKHHQASDDMLLKTLGEYNDVQTIEWLVDEFKDMQPQSSDSSN